MSAQGLNIMLVDLFRSEQALARFESEPDTVMVGYEVTDEERTRLKAKDMGWLYTRGVHPYILLQFALAIHQDIPQYIRQVQSATGQVGP